MATPAAGRDRQTLFEGNDKQAAAYAKNRPSYPGELFDAIYQYAGGGAGTDVALDVATGFLLLTVLGHAFRK